MVKRTSSLLARGAAKTLADFIRMYVNVCMYAHAYVCVCVVKRTAFSLARGAAKTLADFICMFVCMHPYIFT